MTVIHETAVFVSKKPFAKYETARFHEGIYRTDDPDEIAMLKKSKLFNNAFRMLTDIEEEGTSPLFPTEPAEKKPMEKADIDALLEEALQKDMKETQEVIEEFKDFKPDYRAMDWHPLKRYARELGIPIQRYMTRPEVEKLIEEHHNGNSAD